MSIVNFIFNGKILLFYCWEYLFQLYRWLCGRPAFATKPPQIQLSHKSKIKRIICQEQRISRPQNKLQRGLRKQNTNNISFVSFIWDREKKTFFPPFLSSQKRGGVQGVKPLTKTTHQIFIRGFAVAPEPFRIAKINMSRLGATPLNK